MQQQQRPSPPTTAIKRTASAFREYTKGEWGRSRVLLGVFAMILHAFGCLFYLGMAKLHVYVMNNQQAVLTLQFTGVDLLQYFDVVIGTSIVLGVLHALAVFGSCYWAVVFDRRSCRVRADAETTAAHATKHPVAPPPRTRWQRLQDTLSKWDHALEDATGADSYESLIVVEIGLQTYQAHKMSRLVATHWINRLMALAIVANCWIVPGVAFMCRKKPPSYVKVVQLALDAVIEIVYGMAIPLAIFYPYYRDATAILYDTPYLGWYTDTMYVNAIAENLQLFVSSWIDFASKMAPGFTLLIRVYAFQAQRVEHESSTRAASLVVTEPKHSMRRRKKRIVNTLMALWGLGVLVAHLVAAGANLAGSDSGCLLEPIPLGSTRYSCAVLEVSCSQKRISGVKNEIDATLSRVDPLTVQALIFSHCEALEMPPRLKTFANLIEIKIHNVSIAEWGDDAALTAHEHPNFKVLFVSLTNMSRIPDGLLSAHPPPLLVDVEFCGTNLTSIPDDLFDMWATLPYFGLELSPGVTEFPRALRRTTAPPMFSLASNAISEIPIDLFVDHKYKMAVLTGNPIERLPDNVGSAAAVSILSFALTKISTVPTSWLAAREQFVENKSSVAAKDTPLCASLLEVRSRHLGLLRDDNATLPWILCGDAAFSSALVYPLEMEKQFRANSRR